MGRSHHQAVGLRDARASLRRTDSAQLRRARSWARRAATAAAARRAAARARLAASGPPTARAPENRRHGRGRAARAPVSQAPRRGSPPRTPAQNSRFSPRGESPLHCVGVADANAPARPGSPRRRRLAGRGFLPQAAGNPRSPATGSICPRRSDRPPSAPRPRRPQTRGRKTTGVRPARAQILSAEAHEAPDSSAREMRPRCIVCVASLPRLYL